MTLINHSENEEKLDSKKNSAASEADSQWGYDLYPERRQSSKNQSFLKGRNNIDKYRCERSVYKCIKESPLVKLMMGALKSAGCEIDIRRHISCEECAPNVSGGFDPVLNQVVICHNTARKEGIVQGVLTHELIHMFDYCKHELDFKNLDHLACTEIRAANLAHCSFLSALTAGDIPGFSIAETHQLCVKNKALSSIMAARDVSQAEALDAINRVFNRCYADLEPIGRRLRRNSDDMYKAHAEGYYYGYT